MLIKVNNSSYSDINDFMPTYINPEYIVSISVKPTPEENFYKVRMVNGETYTLDQRSIDNIFNYIHKK